MAKRHRKRSPTSYVFRRVQRRHNETLSHSRESGGHLRDGEGQVLGGVGPLELLSRGELELWPRGCEGSRVSLV